MKITSLTLANFRCFGPQPESITFQNDLTCLIGNNASGKTAVFQALNRLFGVGARNRRVVKEDFYIGKDSQSLADGAELYLDVIMDFPELAADVAEASNSVPEFFKHMQVEGVDNPPKVRMLLKATWNEDGTAEGVVTEDIRWANTLDEAIDFESCQRVQPAERSAIQFIYVPAKRDAMAHVEAVLKSRLWRAASWSNEIQAKSIEAISSLQAQFSQEPSVKLVNETLTEHWQQLHSENLLVKPEMHLLENDFQSLIKSAAFLLSPDEAGLAQPVSSLSDGQSSLFCMALVATVLLVEGSMNKAEVEAFSREQLGQRALTLVAIEEPENNLSPFYLSKIVNFAKQISANSAAQVFLSSHSPALVGRIQPDQMRYLRLDAQTRTSYCKSLALPDGNEEVGKYVRLAVQAYPELYFARFVILAEGDSERLIIPRVAEAMGIDLDPSFVPVVPLNGRYVEHFWKLLEDLEIPYATLVDLDLGRKHGGITLLDGFKEKLGVYHGSELAIDLMALKNTDLLDGQHIALKEFQKLGLFFSNPIDIDFSMLLAFQEHYRNSLEGTNRNGPRESTFRSAVATVLKEGGNTEVYSGSEVYTPEFFAWYRYLFLGNSKPDSHLLVLSKLENPAIASCAPPELVALIEHVSKSLA